VGMKSALAELSYLLSNPKAPHELFIFLS
jgi:hypothetical protein